MKLSCVLRVAAGVATTAGLVGCSALAGTASNQPVRVTATATVTATPSGAVTGAGTATAQAGTTTAAKGADAALLAKLLPLPAGARGWTHNKTGVLNLNDFVEGFYKQSAWDTDKSIVQRRGFVVAARHGWFNPDGTQAEVFVVQFSSAQGAKSMYLGLTSSWSEAGATATTFTDPVVHGTGELGKNLDSIGDMAAKDATYVGNMFIYAAVFDPASANKDAVMALARQQYALLGG